jgi:hypothetical protein
LGLKKEKIMSNLKQPYVNKRSFIENSYSYFDEEGKSWTVFEGSTFAGEKYVTFACGKKEYRMLREKDISCHDSEEVVKALHGKFLAQLETSKKKRKIA